MQIVRFLDWVCFNEIKTFYAQKKRWIWEQSFVLIDETLHQSRCFLACANNSCRNIGTSKKYKIEPGQFKFKSALDDVEDFFQTGCLKSLVLASLKPFLLQCLARASWLSFRAFIIIRYVWVMPLDFYLLFSSVLEIKQSLK